MELEECWQSNGGKNYGKKGTKRRAEEPSSRCYDFLEGFFLVWNQLGGESGEKKKGGEATDKGLQQKKM